MREHNNQSKWQQVSGKKRAHWGIFNPDNLPKANGKYSRLNAQLQACYKAAKDPGDNKPNHQKSEDFSI
jgi:uncharacterized protein YjbJ (UPF0337 family)